MRTLSILLLSCIYTISCRTADRQLGPTEVTEHADLEALKIAAAWEDPDIQVVSNLISRFDAYEMVSEANAYFGDLALRKVGEPEHPWILAAAGLFQIQDNKSVHLLRRTGFVREGVALLDQAVEEEAGFATYLRGVALVNLPASFDETERGIADLEWVLEQGAAFPDGVRRAAHHHLATGFERLGNESAAAESRRRAGHSGDVYEGTLTTDFAVTRADGFRFGNPRVLDVGNGIYQAEAFDFGDIGFIEADGGLIVIDAGTFPDQAEAALEAVRAWTSLPVRQLVLTHGHWDHIGGAAAFPSSEVVVSQAFEEEVAIAESVVPPFQWFFGERPVDLGVQPDRLIASPEPLGTSRNIQLIPVQGGETHDALLVHVEDAGVVFVGDAFMPYFGAPFTPEGNPRELLATIDTLLALEPTRILHGHPPLTRLYTVERLPALRSALAELMDHVDESLRNGRVLEDLLRDNTLPSSLEQSPDVVLPYLVMREGVIKRMVSMNTGYWKADRTGIDTVSRDDWGRALKLLGSEREIADAVERLMGGGEATLPLEMLEAALSAYPQSERLLDQRKRALQRLRRVNHGTNPFKLIVYSESADSELQPMEP